MWVDGSACSESFASFSSVTFSLFQLPFLYNYTGCSSEQQCWGADSPSNNRAGCLWNLHPYLAQAVGKWTFNSTGETVGGYSDSFAEGSLPSLSLAELCVIALPVPGRVINQRYRDHLPSFPLSDCLCDCRRQWSLIPHLFELRGSLLRKLQRDQFRPQKVQPALMWVGQEGRVGDTSDGLVGLLCMTWGKSCCGARDESASNSVLFYVVSRKQTNKQIPKKSQQSKSTTTQNKTKEQPPQKPQNQNSQTKAKKKTKNPTKTPKPKQRKPTKKPHQTKDPTPRLF